MQTAGEFIAEFLETKLNLHLEGAQRGAKALSPFFVPGLHLYTTLSDAEEWRNDTVLDVLETPLGAEVITAGHPKLGRSKYRLQCADQSWKISGAAYECWLCRKRGGANPHCKYCKGIGWKEITHD